MDVILVILFLTLNRFHILFWVGLYFEQVNTDLEATMRKNSLEVYFLDLGFVQIKKKQERYLIKYFHIFLFETIYWIYMTIYWSHNSEQNIWQKERK